MFDKLKRLLSYISPWPIYKGQGMTITDNERFTKEELKSIFDTKTVSRVTAKYILNRKYCVYELVGVFKDSNTDEVQYKLLNCMTNQELVISKATFEQIFSKLSKEQLNE